MRNESSLRQILAVARVNAGIQGRIHGVLNHATAAFGALAVVAEGRSRVAADVRSG